MVYISGKAGVNDMAEITERNIEKVEPIPKVTPITTPVSTPTPMAIPTVSPTLDSDGDGVPDKCDFTPYDPNVQTKSGVETPAFEAIFAIVGLLVVMSLLRRRK